MTLVLRKNSRKLQRLTVCCRMGNSADATIDSVTLESPAVQAPEVGAHLVLAASKTSLGISSDLETCLAGLGPVTDDRPHNVARIFVTTWKLLSKKQPTE
jgi:hypothetical protein